MMTRIIWENFYFPLFVGLILFFVKKYLDLLKVNQKDTSSKPVSSWRPGVFFGEY